MASWNKIEVCGFIGRDSELRYTTQGTAVADFSIASTERGKDGQESTLWFKVTVWGQRAESLAQYLIKGAAVFVRGTLSIREYTDRDGNTRFSNEIRADELQFVGRRENSERAAAASGSSTPEPINDESIPF